MTTSLDKTLIGVFMLVGIALFVLGIILLGGRRLLVHEAEYVLYFDGSVSGLSAGAPVVFRGMPMGSVTRLRLDADETFSNVAIPVYIQLDADSIVPRGRPATEEAEQEIVRKMVQNGMHARLNLQSLITGQSRIEMDFYPGAPKNFRSGVPDMEIPTLPSTMDALQRVLNNLPLDHLAQSLDAILANMALALSDGKLKEGVAAFADTFTQARDILQDEAMRQTLAETVKQFSAAAKAVGTQTPEAMNAFRDTMRTMAEAAEQARRVAVSANDILGKDASSASSLQRLLHECIAAARALREFANTLERNPEVLLRGKKGSY